MSSERNRLEKLLGMLGSSFDGERASAALLIANMARKADLTIVQLIEREFKSSHTYKRPQQHPTRNEWYDFLDNRILNALRTIRLNPNLTEWERSFIANILIKKEDDDQLTDNQRLTAEELILKYGSA